MRAPLAVAFLLGASLAARAQDESGGAGAESVVEIEVRTERTLTDPGTPVAGAAAAFASPGAGPAELAPIGARGGKDGVVRLPFPRGGGTLLVWADGFAPTALHADRPRPYTVVLDRAAPFSVQVFAPGSAPAAQASVAVEASIPVLAAPAEVPERHTLTLRAACDAQGRATFTGLPAVPLSLTASAPGLLDARRFPVDPRTGSLVLVLGRGARVGGTLRLLPGMVPAAGAVALVRDRSATLDASGRFVVDGVVPGRATIRFEGRGFVPPQPRNVLVAEGRDREDLEFEAWRTSALVGRLRDEEQRPLAAARIEIAWPPSSGLEDSVRDVTCDAEGKFRMEDVAPGDGVGLRVTAPGRAAASVEGVSLPPGGVSRDLEIELPLGGAVAGVLLDLEGRPLARAELTVFRRDAEDAGLAVASGETADDGRFALDGLPVAEVVLRVATAGARAPARFGPWILRAGEVRDVGELRTFGGFDLEGRVDAAPDGTHVRALFDGREISSAPLVDGAFTLRGLPAGDVEVRAVRDEETGATVQASLPSAWPLALVWQASGDLRVQIFDEGGAVVAVATARLLDLDRPGESDSSRTIDVRDAEGRISVRVAPGRWRVEATDARGYSGSVEVVVGRDGPPGTVPLVLSPGVAIRGRAVDARDGRPLEGAVVRAVSVDGASAAAGPADVVDDGGNFLLRGVPPGLWRVEIRSAGHPLHMSAPFVARLADAPDLGRIEVGPGVQVEGEIRAGSGAPGAGLHVELLTDEGTSRAAETDRFGRYALSGIEPGLAVMAVISPAGRVLREARVLVPDVRDAWRLDVDLGGGGTLRGRVSTGGRDEPYARVAFRSGNGRDVVRVETVCDENGAFFAEGVPRGRAEVEVRPADAALPWATSAEINGGAGQWIDLRLPEGSVEGQVRASDGGAAIARAVVELRSSGDTAALTEAMTGEDGRYRLLHVEPGTYDVVATRAGFGTAIARGVTVGETRGATDVDLDVRPHAEIVLRLVDMRLRPVTDGWAEARSLEIDDGDSGEIEGLRRSRASADASGRVVVRGLSRGAWRLSAGGGSLATLDLGIVRIDEGPNDFGEMALPAAGALDVLAFPGPTGPAAGVVVELRDALGRDPRPAREGDDEFGRPDPRHATDSSGRLRIAGLATGVYRLWAEGHEESAVRVVVRAEVVSRVWLPVGGR